MNQVDEMTLDEQLKKLKARLDNLRFVKSKQELKRKELLDKRDEYQTSMEEIENKMKEKKTEIVNAQMKAEEMGLSFSLFGQIFHAITKTKKEDSVFQKTVKVSSKIVIFLLGVGVLLYAMKLSPILFGITSIALAISVNSLELHAKENKKNRFADLSHLKNKVQTLTGEIGELENQKKQVQEEDFKVSKEVRGINQSLITTNRYMKSITEQMDDLYMNHEEEKLVEEEKVYRK